MGEEPQVPASHCDDNRVCLCELGMMNGQDVLMAQHILQHCSSCHLYPGSRFARTLFHWLKRTTIFLLSARHSSTSGMPHKWIFILSIFICTPIIQMVWGDKSKRGSQAEDFVSAGREFPALHQSRVEPETGKLFYKAGDWLMSREIPGERMSGSRKPQQNRFEKNIINLHSHWIIDRTLRTKLRVSTCRQKELPKTNRAAAGQAATEKMEVTLIIMTVVYF